jgi:hypothetical protein
MEKPQSAMPIVGGMFGLAAEHSKTQQRAPFLSAGTLRFVNARSALLTLLTALKPSRVWLPSFLCDALIPPIDVARIPISFYNPGDTLQPEQCDNNIPFEQGHLLLQIHYFGFPPPDALAERARASGAWVLDDAAQALLSQKVGHSADFTLTSPRKFVGLPDGATLEGLSRLDLPPPGLASPPVDWCALAVSAATGRTTFDQGGDDRTWFQQFQLLEDSQPLGAFAMSDVSSALLDTAFDWKTIASRRRENYLRLLTRLGSLALFPTLPDSVVPLGFPLRLASRDEVRAKLIARGFFPPVHWPVPGRVPADFTGSRRLATQIMTLPCDQRYGATEMEQMASELLHCLGTSQ